MTAGNTQATGSIVMDDRLRQRWIDVRRQAGRRRLRILIAALAVVVVVALGFGLLHSPALRVRHVRITGQGAVPAQTVAAAAGLAGQTLMIDVKTGQIAARLDALPWVGTAKVSRDWPATVRISLTTRTAVATVALPSGQQAQLDATGRVLALVSQATPGQPVLTGVPLRAVTAGGWIPGAPGPAADPTAPASSRLVAPPTLTAASLALAAALPASIRAQVQAVTVEANRTLQLSLAPSAATTRSGSATVLLGQPTQLADKLTALTAVLQGVELSPKAQVDLQDPSRPTVTGTSTGQDAASS